MSELKERLNPQTKVEVLSSAMPYVLIDGDALRTMQLYIEECPDEIGWLCSATRSGRAITIHQTYLFEQEVHSTTTEITPDGLAKFGEELLAQPDGMDIWNSIKAWGHSHVNMGITPSAQDNTQMNTFKEGGHDWFVRIIGNKKGDMKIDIYDYEHGIIYTDVPWARIASEQEGELQAQLSALQKQMDELKKQLLSDAKEPIKEEIKEKVSKLTYTSGSWAKGKVWSYTKRMYVFPEDLPDSEKKTHKTGTTTQHTQTSRTTNSMKNGIDNFPVTSRDTLESKDDVLNWFTEWELWKLSTARDLYELNDMLEDKYAIYNFFSEDDLSKIFQVSFIVYQNVKDGTKSTVELKRKHDEIEANHKKAKGGAVKK